MEAREQAQAAAAQPQAPLTAYLGIVCDLDGVVYRGPSAVPGAIEALAALPVPVVYATNNASRPPAQVAEHLRRLGLSLDEADVVNSSMAGAAELAQRLDPGTRVLAVGGEGVALALRDAGLVPVGDSREPVGAVLQGYGPAVTAADLAEAAYAVEAGAVWVATNTDLTLPTDRGVAPGNGSLVGCVANASGTTPYVVGKPFAPLYLMATAVLGLEPARVLGVGDRLETDIEGATAAGMDSALVLTGVHGARACALAPPPARPRFLLADLSELTTAYVAARVLSADAGQVRVECGCAATQITESGLSLSAGDDPREVMRAGVAAIWAYLDAGGDRHLAEGFAAQLPDRL